MDENSMVNDLTNRREIAGGVEAVKALRHISLPITIWNAVIESLASTVLGLGKSGAMDRIAVPIGMIGKIAEALGGEYCWHDAGRSSLNLPLLDPDSKGKLAKEGCNTFKSIALEIRDWTLVSMSVLIGIDKDEGAVVKLALVRRIIEELGDDKILSTLVLKVAEVRDPLVDVIVQSMRPKAVRG